jgi:hypothetical protein
MLGILYRLLVGTFHTHHWQVYSMGQVYYDPFVRHEVRTILLRCSKCGTIKEKVVGP